MNLLVKKPSFIIFAILTAIIILNYTFTIMNLDENFKLLILFFAPYLFCIFNRKKYVLLFAILISLRFLLIGAGLLHFDYFSTDGEAYYSAYIIVKDVLIDGGEIPDGQQHILNSPIWLATGLYYFLLGVIMSSSDFSVLLAFNYLFIFFSALIWVKINNYSKISIVTSILVLISPESYIFGSYIGKEVVLLFLAMVAIYIVQSAYLNPYDRKKQYLLLIAVVVAGTFIRPYFIAIIIAYLVFLNYIEKKSIVYLLIGYVATYIFIATHYELYNMTIHIRNFAANYLGLLLSPNLFNIQNWDNFFFSTGFHVIGLMLIFLSIVLTLKIKPYMKMTLLAIFFYAVPMALVVSTYSHHQDLSVYAFYIPRTRFPIVFIIYTAFVISLSYVMRFQSVRKGSLMFLPVVKYYKKIKRVKWI